MEPVSQKCKKKAAKAAAGLHMKDWAVFKQIFFFRNGRSMFQIPEQGKQLAFDHGIITRKIVCVQEALNFFGQYMVLCAHH
jgi:hypothetical protein